MPTRCKFTCTSVTKSKNWNRSSEQSFVYEAAFTAVTDGSEENKKFFQFTPSGSLKVGHYKEDVFEVGKEYFIDILEAPAAV